MQTPFGHLTYCTNIHAGETWPEHFKALQTFVPALKQKLCADQPFGIGLRISHTASLALAQKETLEDFKEWLKEQQCYVFTLNGFPYGGFHHTEVKDKVHQPDWTTAERVDYTVRLAKILAALLPASMEGGISTSPLTYRHWHKTEDAKKAAFQQTTSTILQVVEELRKTKIETGKTIHLDIEPEPDGLLESGAEFLAWYKNWLLPMGATYLSEKIQATYEEVTTAIKDHVRLCYDVCHFAVGYENHGEILKELSQNSILVGRIQISAALKALLPAEREKREAVTRAFHHFNEPVYLHQVVARQLDGTLKRYADLPDAFAEADDASSAEWRAHYHVPLFMESYGVLASTRSDIADVLAFQRQEPFTSSLEIETYTWGVLPEELKRPLADSIHREFQWVLNELNKTN